MHRFTIVSRVACSSLMGYLVHRYIVSISVRQRKVLADVAKVRLCLVLDMPYSQFSEKIEEELSDYYLIKYNNDAELTFGGAI